MLNQAADPDSSARRKGLARFVYAAEEPGSGPGGALNHRCV